MRGAYVLLLVVAGFLTSHSRADEPKPPKLTNEEQKLAKEADNLNRQAVELHRQERSDEAVAKLERAIEIYRRIYPNEKDSAGQEDLADCLENLGDVLESMGWPERAVAHYESALALRQRIYPKAKYPAGHRDLARDLSNLARVLASMGQPERALSLYEAALAMRRHIYPEEKYPAGHRALALSFTNLGFVLNSMGRPEQALPYHEAAMAMYRRLYPVEKYPEGHAELAGSLNHFGFVLNSMGQPERALPQLESALAMRRRLYPEREYPAGHVELTNSLNNLGLVLSSLGRPHEALPYYESALAMRHRLYPKAKYRAGHPDLATSLNNLGFVLKSIGQPEQARPHLEAALAMRRRLYPVNRHSAGHRELAASHNNLGLVLNSMGWPERALPHYEAALAMYRRLAANVAATRSEGEALNYLGTQPLVLSFLLPAAGRPGGPAEGGYAAAWQARATLARVYQRRHLAAHAGAAAPAALTVFAENTALRRERAGLLLAPPPQSDDGRKERDRRLAELDRRLAESRAKLRDLLPELARADDLAERPPADLQTALPAGTAFLDFFRYTRFEQDPNIKGTKGERRTECYTAFVVTKDAVKRVELGPAEPVEKVVRDWRKALQQEAEPPADLAAALRLALWNKVEELLPAATTTVYLAPDGPLAFVPFAALPGRKPGSVLLEDYALAVVPSGPFLLDQLTAPKAKNAKAGLLAVGDVGYGLDPAASWLLAAAPAPTRGPAAGEGQLSTWAPLPGTAAELGRVSAIAGAAKIAATRLSGADASVGRLVAELSKHRYAHLATHGFFLSDESTRKRQRLDESLFRSSGDERMGAAALSPFLLSGLACAGANKPGTPSRGLLTAEHLLDADLTGMSLCVLSACETGLGEFRQGEGVFGLQQALHIAGCRDVVASLWAVSDEATAALMGLFYDNLWRKGLPPLEALRQAQLDLRRNPALAPGRSLRKAPSAEVALDAGAATPRAAEGAGASRYAPPQKWAAFVLSGAGR